MPKYVEWLASVSKAIAAFFTMFGGQLIIVADEGVTGTEWAVVITMAFGAALAVWAVPNKAIASEG